MRINISFALLSLYLVSACGGGGGDTAAIKRVKVDPHVEQAPQGDWPMVGYVAYYTVQQQSDCVSLWRHRLSSIDCSRDFNQVACDPGTPPAIDFDRYLLVGVYLDHYLHLVDYPEALNIYRDESGLNIQFSTSSQTTNPPTPLSPLTSKPESTFFLVPKSGRNDDASVTICPWLNMGACPQRSGA